MRAMAAAVPHAEMASPAMDPEPEVSAFDQSLNQFCFGRLASWLEAVSAAVVLSLLHWFGTYGDAIEPGGWESAVEHESEGAPDAPYR
jgi:hypothetical protein